jgi:hypothetical protein
MEVSISNQARFRWRSRASLSLPWMGYLMSSVKMEKSYGALCGCAVREEAVKFTESGAAGARGMRVARVE